MRAEAEEIMRNQEKYFAGFHEGEAKGEAKAKAEASASSLLTSILVKKSSNFITTPPY